MRLLDDDTEGRLTVARFLYGIVRGAISWLRHLVPAPRFTFLALMALALLVLSAPVFVPGMNHVLTGTSGVAIILRAVMCVPAGTYSALLVHHLVRRPPPKLPVQLSARSMVVGAVFVLAPLSSVMVNILWIGDHALRDTSVTSAVANRWVCPASMGLKHTSRL